MEPTPQCLARIARCAAASVLPLTFGTTHFTITTGFAVNVAVAERSASRVSVHGPVPEHAPVQPAKVDPEPAGAVSVTDVPWANAWTHAAPQSIPVGALVIEPLPVPALATVSVFCVSKIAVTERAVVMATVHDAVPEQPPIQPVKLEPAAGEAVSVTWVP
jgi:hypothetical protein